MDSDDGRLLVSLCIRALEEVEVVRAIRQMEDSDRSESMLLPVRSGHLGGHF